MHQHLLIIGALFIGYAFRVDDHASAVLLASIGGAILDAGFH